MWCDNTTIYIHNIIHKFVHIYIYKYIYIYIYMYVYVCVCVCVNLFVIFAALSNSIVKHFATLKKIYTWCDGDPCFFVSVCF